MIRPERRLLNIELDLVQSIATTAVLLVAGSWAQTRIGFFRRFCIPGPVIGGFAFALIVLLLRETGVAQISVDTTLQLPAMLVFFTTIGLGANLGLLKTGGRFLLVYLVACWTIAIFQNLVGVGLAKLLGINPLLGIMAGAVSLEGGHGAAAAFGPTAESLGAEAATAVAIAAATFGLIAGGLLGGPVSAFLVSRYKLPLVTRDVPVAMSSGPAEDEPATANSLLTLGSVIAVVMVLGAMLGAWFTESTGFALPAYVGAMLLAILVRNVGDAAGVLHVRSSDMRLISDLSLGYFLTQAMMSLKIWDLYTLALPLIVILAVQVAVLVAFVALVVFRLLGKNYDAAIICGGMMGHGLGGTPNAIANMDAVGRRFGLQSKLGMLIVPLSGAVLIDIVALPWIVFSLNFFG